jgi:cytochrome c biogenesis protein ResB
MAEKKSIDLAIESIEQQIEEHKKEARKILIYVFVFASLILAAGYSIYLIQVRTIINIQSDLPKSTGEIQENSEKTLDSSRLALKEAVSSSTAIQPDPSLVYLFVGVFVVVFGVLMSVYRFHLAEISRAQQYRFGLLRVRIAANNADTAGFGTEVRQALTLEAFHFYTGKEKKVESPLPGHPGSDFGALFLNKIVDKIDVQVKTKD